MQAVTARQQPYRIARPPFNGDRACVDEINLKLTALIATLM